MKSVSIKIAAFIMIVGLLSACGNQATDTPASQPTEAAASTTEAPTHPPLSTDTAAPTEPAAEGATVSFANDVLPIIESRCVNCHGGDRTEEGLSLKTYDSVMAGSEHGSIIAPGNAADSKLVKLILSQKMPKRGPKLTPPQVQIITDWVNQGAVNN